MYRYNYIDTFIRFFLRIDTNTTDTYRYFPTYRPSLQLTWISGGGNAQENRACESETFDSSFLRKVTAIVYYVPRRTMRVIARRATMLAGDQSRGAISPASIVASLVITRIVCIGTYSILCNFGAYTSFYAYTRI